MMERQDSLSPTVQLGWRRQGIESAPIRNQLMAASQRRKADDFRALVESYIARFERNASLLDEVLALHYVVWTNELNDLAERLISFGCNPYAPDFNGDTAFHYAVRGGNLRFLKSLYPRVGDQLFDVLNVHQCNLVLAAVAEAPDEAALEVLNLMEWMWYHGVSLECQDAQGKTPLMWAAQRGSITLCHWLLSRGANLGHRDHMGRTALHMVCSSGDSEVALFLCQKGAVNLIDSESNDDVRINTPVKICWQRGHFWLAMSLKRWQVCHAMFGRCTFLSNRFAWFALFLSLWNLMLGSVMHYRLLQLGSPRATVLGVLFYTFIFFDLVFWLLSAKTDPGYVKEGVIQDQSYRCSRSFSNDIINFDRMPVPGNNNPSVMKLVKLEREALKLSSELVMLNRQYKPMKNMRRNADLDAKFDEYAEKLHHIRGSCNKLASKVAEARRQASSASYVSAVLESGGKRRPCFTCHIIRPFRSHHCSECAACVHRFDHHCVWVDNCIGIKNQRSFFLFLFSLVGALTVYFVIFGSYCYDHVIYGGKDEGQYTPINLLKLLASVTFYLGLMNAALNLAWFIFSSFLLYRTTKSMFSDLTFYESLRPPSHVVRRYGAQPKGWLWELQGVGCIDAFINAWHFCAQSDARDSVNYPATDGTELLPLRRGGESPKRTRKSVGKQQTPSPTETAASPLLTKSTTHPDTAASYYPTVSPTEQDQGLAWRWMNQGPFRQSSKGNTDIISFIGDQQQPQMPISRLHHPLQQSGPR